MGSVPGITREHNERRISWKKPIGFWLWCWSHVKCYRFTLACRGYPHWHQVQVVLSKLSYQNTPECWQLSWKNIQMRAHEPLESVCFSVCLLTHSSMGSPSKLGDGHNIIWRALVDCRGNCICCNHKHDEFIRWTWIRDEGLEVMCSTNKAQRHGLMDVTSIWKGRRAIKKSIRATKVATCVSVSIFMWAYKRSWGWLKCKSGIFHEDLLQIKNIPPQSRYSVEGFLFSWSSRGEIELGGADCLFVDVWQVSVGWKRIHTSMNNKTGLEHFGHTLSHPQMQQMKTCTCLFSGTYKHILVCL